MFEFFTEEQARKEILKSVAEYCDTFHNKKPVFEEGQRMLMVQTIVKICLT